MKKLLTILLVLLLVVGCGKKAGGPGGSADFDTMPDMTDEEITIRVATWQAPALKEALKDAFEDKYPNITLELIDVDTTAWMDSLTNLATSNNFPDVFWYQADVDVPIRNGWLGDLTPYWNADPETKDVLGTLKDQGVFTMTDGSEKKLSAASAYQPFTVFLDENLFKRFNKEMPSTDWTWSEMIALQKEMTIPESGIFGYNTYTLPLTMSPIVNGDAVGEFGWDGEKYDLTGYWAEAIQQHADYINTGVHAPFFDTDEAEAAFGDRLLWAPSSGRVAMQLDAWWTKTLFSTPEFVEKGMKWVPYSVPKGDSAKTLNKPAFVDFGSISPSSENPREAYEVLKWFGWGSEGWEVKLDHFANSTLENGDKEYPYPEGLPMVENSKLWDEVSKQITTKLTADGNADQVKYYDAFLDNAHSPIPLGGASQPGFQTFLIEQYFEGEYGNVESEVNAGNLRAADIAKDLTDKINEIREETLGELFE